MLSGVQITRLSLQEIVVPRFPSIHNPLSAAALLCIACTIAHAQPTNEDFKILADDREAGDMFGVAVAADRGVIVVGAVADDDNGDRSGAAYLFDSATGVQLAKLIPDDGEAGDEFGCAVAIRDGFVVVGARGDDDRGLNSGSAYLFDATTGTQLAKLLADDGGASDGFGVSVSIDDGLVAVGADLRYFAFGAAYVFDASTGDQVSQLLPEPFGAAWSYFGRSVAIENGLVAVGEPYRGQFGKHTGTAYVFDAASGDQVVQLLPESWNLFAQFGWSIAIDGGVVAVGAHQQNTDGVFSAGAGFLFDATSGSQLHMLAADDGVANDYLGTSIAISDGIVAIGAVGTDDNGAHSGAAYVFDAASGTQTAKLVPSDGAAEDHFGHSIAIAGGLVVAGSPQSDIENGANTGSAYLFDLAGCAADFNSDGDVNTLDVLTFLNAWAAGDAAADFNRDGSVNTLDVLAFLNAWTAGC